MSTRENAHRGMEDSVAKVCAKSPHGLSVKGVQVQLHGQAVGLKETIMDDLAGTVTGEIHSRIDSVQVFEVESASRGTLWLAIPWNGPFHLPHEVFSVVKGKLPCGLYLVAEEGAFTGSWRWSASGASTGRVVDALTEAGKSLYPDTAFTMELGDRSYPLEWGIQAVPIDADTYFYTVQLAPGLISANLGLDDFLAKQAAFDRVISALGTTECKLADFRFDGHAKEHAHQAYPDMGARMVAQANDQRLVAAQRLMEFGQLKQARYALEESLRTEPGNAALLALRDEVARRIQRVDELEKQAKQSAKGGDPEAAAAAYGELLELVKGDKAKAREIDAALKQLVNDRVAKLFKAAQALAASGDPKGAAEKLQVLLSLRPAHAMARDLLAKCGGA